MEVSQGARSVVRGWLLSSPKAGSFKSLPQCTQISPRPGRLGLGAELTEEELADRVKKKDLESKIERKLSKSKRKMKVPPESHCKSPRDSSPDEECSKANAVMQPAMKTRELLKGGCSSTAIKAGRKRRKRKKRTSTILTNNTNTSVHGFATAPGKGPPPEFDVIVSQSPSQSEIQGRSVSFDINTQSNTDCRLTQAQCVHRPQSDTPPPTPQSACTMSPRPAPSEDDLLQSSEKSFELLSTPLRRIASRLKYRKLHMLGTHQKHPHLHRRSNSMRRRALLALLTLRLDDNQVVDRRLTYD